jgi:hypothetical protein
LANENFHKRYPEDKLPALPHCTATGRFEYFVECGFGSRTMRPDGGLRERHRDA